MRREARSIRVIVILFCVQVSRCGFEYCHDEPGSDPEEGIAGDLEYKWLGALQYIHIEKGTPEYFRVPRVVLVSAQYVLATARDAARVPPGYALGNVIFDQYEVDERECELTLQQIESGRQCASGVLSAPIADVFIHPEYEQQGVRDTLAILQLLAPVTSRYLLPICLPFSNNLLAKDGKLNNWMFHVDYLSVTPRDMINENREISRITILPQHKCLPNKNSDNSTVGPIICTSSCEFRSGAPSVVHERTGHWSLEALAIGGAPCADPLRSNTKPAPARHILVHPYIEWIAKTISGVPQAPFAKDDPFGFELPRVLAFSPNKLPRYKQLQPGWLGHWWLAGFGCYYRGPAADNMYKFYTENFSVYPENKEQKNYHIEIVSPPGLAVNCVKVGLPYQVVSPEVWDLGTSLVKLHVPIVYLEGEYRFHVEAWTVNDTSQQNKPSSREDNSHKDILT